MYYVFAEWRHFDGGGMESWRFNTEAEALKQIAVSFPTEEEFREANVKLIRGEELRVYPHSVEIITEYKVR